MQQFNKSLTKVKKDHPRAIYLFAIDLTQWKLTGFMDIPIKTLAAGCPGQLGGNPCTSRPAMYRSWWNSAIKPLDELILS